MIAALKRTKAQGVLERCGSTIYVVEIGGRRASEIPWSLDTPARAVRPLATRGTLRITRGIVVIEKDAYATSRAASRTAGSGGLSRWRQLAKTGKWSLYRVGCDSGLRTQSSQ